MMYYVRDRLQGVLDRLSIETTFADTDVASR